MNDLKALKNLLNKREIKVLAWYYYDGKKHQEMADALGIKKSTLNEIKWRAIQKLKDAGFDLPDRWKKKQTYTKRIMSPYETSDFDNLIEGSLGAYKWNNSKGKYSE